MKVLVQRVLNASVEVDHEMIASIEHGLLLFVCFEEQDTIDSIEPAIYKIKNLRIFEDDKRKMNDNILDVKGSILSISQFTLSWDGSKGHRPSFDKSLAPEKAKILFKVFNDKLKEENINVKAGRFGVDMKINSVNDGPVTFMLNL